MRGIYILTISISKNIAIKVGSLGKVSFEKGTYVYVGSAQNNLEKRIERHLGKAKKRFWHIDYLLHRRFVKVDSVFYKIADKSEECEIARNFSKNECAPIEGFGCSDCDCGSHLFMLAD